MRAIFIGGPLHGETKIVESSHTRCAWVPPYRGVTEEVEVVTYHRRMVFGGTAIFALPDQDVDGLLIEAIERGLQLSAEPPLREVIEILFRLHAGHAFLDGPANEVKNIEFLVDLVQSYWKRQQDFKSRK